MPQEIELKFVAPVNRAGELAAVEAALGDAPPRTLTSIYYDTDKAALRRAGLALRVRREGESFTQTLKDAGDGFGRGEWEARVAGPEPAPELLGATPAGPILAKNRRLAPRFVVDVRRRTADLDEGETLVELSLDEGVAKARGREARFLELELELKGGPRAGLFALARRLTTAADLTLSFVSKAERGDALARSPRSQARKFKPPTLRTDMTAGESFQQIARACMAQISSNAERLRRRASPEVVHQLRVGIRRLRSALSSFKKAVADNRVAAVEAELEWLSGELDAARNLDVLLHGEYRTALGRKQDPEGLKGLGAALRGARRMAYVRAAAAVESDRYRRLMLDLLIWVEAGPWSTSEACAKAREKPITRFAANDLSKRRRKIARCGRRLGELDPSERHKLRIAAKKLRYGADVFVGLYGRSKRAKAFIGTLKEVQDALGELNDIVVGERLAHDTAVRSGGAAEPAFVAGRITAVQATRVAPLTERAERALGALWEAKPFWKRHSHKDILISRLPTS